MVGESVGREEVSKEPLQESADSLVIAMEARSEQGRGEDFDSNVGDTAQPRAVRFELYMYMYVHNIILCDYYIA